MIQGKDSAAGLKRKLRMGMIGGGRGGFIGGVHRIAAALDQQIDLVCGAFSSDPQRSKDSGQDFYLPEERCYGSFEEMLEKEAALPLGEKMDFVVIVTPNHMHFPAAKAALEAGFHVLSDKPATFDLAQAKALQSIVEETGLIYGVTYNYTGYPMVKHARQLVKDSKIGKVRKVIAEYPQGWLATKLEDTDQKQAAWRTDPTKSGAAGCVGDIASHAENLTEYIAGSEIDELAADLTTFVDGRLLDDDANILLRFKNGAKGVLHSSQISVGQENNLSIRVYGELGGVEWHQKDPNTLLVSFLEGPTEIHRTSSDYVEKAAASAARLPAAHVEGYLEAFANLYKSYADHVRSRLEGAEVDDLSFDYPRIDDGVRGMAFIEACVASAKDNAGWTSLDH